MLTLLAYAFLVSPVPQNLVDAMDEIYKAIARAKAETRALVVEFDKEESDRFERTSKRFKGTFRLLRSPKNGLCASLDIIPKDNNNPTTSPFRGLLVND